MAGRLLWCVVVAATLVAGGARPALAFDADPTERAIHEAADRVYQQELRDLARTDALDNDADAFELAYHVYARVREAALAWFPGSSAWNWEMHLSSRLDSAWSAPGCKLMVGNTLVHQLAQDDAALAFVIGHELAHCLLQHSRVLMDAAVDQDLRLARLQTQDLLWMIDGDIRQVLRLAPVSRQLEEEADRLGMMLAADAGYDPAKMAAYFRIAGEASGMLAGTHAANSRRIASLDTLLPVAQQLFDLSRR
jgi:Zn-dependent protease with chaperone function